MSEDPKVGKRGLPKDDRAHDDEEEGADGEAAAAAATSGTTRKKRLRGAAATSDKNDTTNTTNNNTIDLFSEGLITNAVFSYLDVRELLAVSSTSRVLRARIRHHHVVRAALLHGGHAKTSVERLVPLIRQPRQIWTPSPLRLLRLVNGKRCERCNAGRVNLVSGDYGVFLCWGRCLQQFTKKVARNQKWNPFLWHPRVASADYASNGYLFTHPYRDTTGDPCGPLITMRPHMERVQQGTTTLEELLEECDRQDAENCANGGGGGADEIVQAFDEAKEAAQRRMAEKKNEKRIASDRALAKKLEKIQAMVTKIKHELGDGAAPWKDVVLAYTVVPFRSSNPPVAFESPLVRQLLEDYVKAPSKATPKKVTELKERLWELFRVVVMGGETGGGHFYDFSFLSETDPMESALREHYSARYPAHEHLTLLGTETLRLLGQGELLHVLEQITSPNQRRNTFLQGGFAEILVPSIAATVEIVGDDDEDTKKRRSKALQLAKRLWKRERGDLGKPADFHACYQSCLDTFPVLYQQVLDFLNSPETQAWKESSDPTKARYRALQIEEVWTLDDLWIAVSEKRDYEEIWKKAGNLQRSYRF